ncbi:MAG TPA: hypothetical protein VJ521_16475, partial [Acidobacteriota bacterium]|nr:hypothetical protein [Acidobacteriota bacterium]
MLWDSWRSDLVSAVRLWFRTPVLGIVIVIILALGIGLNTTIFSLIDTILFRPFPVRDPHELVRIFASDEKGNELSNSSYPVY